MKGNSSLIPQPRWWHLYRLPPEGQFSASEGYALSAATAPGERKTEPVCKPEGKSVK